MPEKSYKKKHMTSFQLIIMGFAGVILLGTVLLMLPFSSAEKVITPFHEALFTATSAVCVTGLVVKDTGSYWSLAGQTIILALIQIGGLGVVTVAASVSILSGKKISLMQRSTMQDAISAPKVGGIVRLTRFILRGTFLIEAAGTVLLLPVFMGDYGKKGIWMSVFHSISAFCNAGFDILGTDSSMFPSLTGYSGNILINLVIMLLIITGGIGFLTWDDIYTNKLNFKRYRMQSKIILMTTACLILFPTVFFYICDLTKLPMEKRLLAAAFQSVTTRTAGFNTINISEMSEASKAVMILLMLIGGSPGSTAGGMKTTTFSVLILNAIATFRSQENEKDIRKMFSIIDKSFQKVTVMVETMSPFVVKHMKEKSIEGSNAKFTWGVKNRKELQRIIPAFSVRQEVSLVEGMKELMPVYCVIGKIPAVRNISNKIIVLEKRGRY